jgi:Spy/CpxP family protein refolding chaperone
MEDRLTRPPARRARLLGLALLALTFVAGALAGAAFSRTLVAREPQPAAASAAGAPCPPRDGGGTPRILRELDLTAEQQRRIDAITARRRVQMDAFWNGEGRRLRAIVDSTRAEIRAVLTPAQAAEYDRLREEHRRRKHREGRGDGKAD